MAFSSETRTFLASTVLHVEVVDDLHWPPRTNLTPALTNTRPPDYK